MSAKGSFNKCYTDPRPSDAGILTRPFRLGAVGLILTIWDRLGTEPTATADLCYTEQSKLQI